MSNETEKKYVIINADDLGLTIGTNLGIQDAHQKGILTSASLLVTCPSFRHATGVVKANSDLGVGIHLSLNLGKSVVSARKIPRLVDKDGYFYPSFARLLFINTRMVREQIRWELHAQVEKAMKHNIKLDHINSQSHVHMIPHIFPIVAELANEYKIPFVRVSNEKMFRTNRLSEDLYPLINTNILKMVLLNTLAKRAKKHLKNIKTTHAFYGVQYTSSMTDLVMRVILGRVQTGVTEILSHPGLGTVQESRFDFRKQAIYDFMTSDNRRKELSVLMNTKLSQYIMKKGINLITFKKAAAL